MTRAGVRAQRPTIHGIVGRIVRVWLAVGLYAALATPMLAQSPPPPPPPPAERAPAREMTEAERRAREAEREALKEQIRTYSELVQAMRESLAVREGNASQVAEIEQTVDELSRAIGEITDQLADLQLDVVDNRVRLRDGQGGEVTLEIPEDLPDQLSAGLSSITRMFLEEMPDTVRIGEFETGFTWDRDAGRLRVSPMAPTGEKRVIEGGLVKIRDDMEIAANEKVVGDAVAIMGDAQVAGRVVGDLVVVMGDALLEETAVVDGQVITILGRLDRADGAEVGSVTVINPGVATLSDDIFDTGGGWIAFGSYQLLFVLLLACVLLLLALAPARRREVLVETVQGRPLPSLGLGLLAVLVGHGLMLGLAAILVLTVIGIPVALLVLVALMLLDLAGIGLGSLAVGRWICARQGLGCPRPWRELILGMLVLHVPAFLSSLLGAVAAPAGLVMLLAWFGGFIKLITFCVGLGALLLSRFGTPQATPPIAPPLNPIPESTGP
jgi:hypothetical protein